MAKKRKKNIQNNFLSKSIFSLAILAILVVAVGAYFVDRDNIIGPLFIVLGFVAVLFLKSYGFTVRQVVPDIWFGIIDNGILVFAAVLGGVYAGVVGAVIGGAAGNTITDGLGGLVEGHFAERLRKEKVNDERNALSTMLGKVIGCLWGAGAALILVWLIKIF